MPITPQQARAELARRELARRGVPIEQPQQPVGEISTPQTFRQNQLERQISQRPDLYNQAVQMLQQRLSPEGQPFTIPQMANLGLKSLGGVLQRGESAIAAPFYEMPRGIPAMAKGVKQAITGEKRYELGDIARQTGIPEPISAGLGLVGTGILGGALAKGAGLTKKATDLGKLETTYGRDISRNIIKQTSQMTDEAVDYGMTKGWKNILTKENLNPQKGYNFVLRAKRGLQNFYRNINNRYGEELDKISQNVDLDLPVDNIKLSLQQRLQNNGIIDLNGNELRTPIDKVEKEILRIYDSFKNISGNIGLKDIVKLKNRLWGMVRKTALEGNQPINSNERIIYDLQGEIGRALQLAGEVLPSDRSILSLNQLNSWYAQNRTLFNMANNVFKVFKNDYATKTAESAFNRYFKLDIGTKTLLQDIDNILPQSSKFLDAVKDWRITQDFMIQPTGGMFQEMYRVPAKYLTRQYLRSGAGQVAGKGGQVVNRYNLIPASVSRMLQSSQQE